ncbi:MAG: type I 3-dehydroquinate dehydratase [Deltaproteobacteria bacterium]|nr:type I 3-dehydroquinate dehydratase [Deltaproteobacteria bacterium]
MNKAKSEAGVPRIAGVIVEEVSGRTVRKAINAGADLLEVRVDTFRDRNTATVAKELEKLKAYGGNIPLLITVRSRKEGGKHPISDRKRAEMYEALMPMADLIDIELSSSEILKNVVNSADRNKKKVIISYHNFKSTPGDKILKDIIKKARSSGADIVKIAATAKNAGDLKRLAAILAGSDDLIVIAMGRLGAASRIFFPMLGSLVTYGSVTEATAPGQLSINAIKKEFSRYGF